MHMIDYFLITVLRTLLWNTYNDLLQVFKLHSQFLPLDDSQLENLKINEPIPTKRQSIFEVSTFKIVQHSKKKTEQIYSP